MTQTADPKREANLLSKSKDELEHRVEERTKALEETNAAMQFMLKQRELDRKEIQEGATLVSKTNGEFIEVEASSARMGELVGEISAASGEQAQGIEQVSKAVSDVDKVVQRNSASAEESASASEEMNAQATQLKELVADLAKIVEGANGRQGGTTAWKNKSVKKTLKSFPATRRPAGKTDEANGQHRSGSGKAPARPPMRAPEEIIPFDSDVSEF